MLISADPPYLNSLLVKDDPDTKWQLEYGSTVRDRVANIFRRVASANGSPSHNVRDLQTTVDRLLAREKALKIKLDRFEEENSELSTKLNDASYRVVRAEKKINRLKSTQVQKMEQAAVANATRSAAGGSENGIEEAETSRNSAELQLRLDETLAVEARQREQLEALTADLKRLQEENSSLKARRESLTDEDFIRTDVFKAFKSQNEELIRKVNHLESLTKELKDQNGELHSRQTAFQTELETSAQKEIQDLEEEIRQKDQDLARIRSARDEILADREMRKASMDQDTKAMEHMTELVSAKDDRIAFLELELSRYKPADDVKMEDTKPEVDQLPVDELREQYQKVLKDYQALNQELPSIEQAYKKFQALAQKKVMDFKAMEEQLAMARAEKSKADQKYFAVRKDTDTRIEQNKVLRMQNAKSSEVIEKLKEAEAQRRSLIANLEKQVTDLKQSNMALSDEIKKRDGESTDVFRRAEAFKSQVSDMTNLVKSRDAATALFREQSRTHEEEAERLRVRVDHIQKDRDNWKQKAQANSSEEEELLRVRYYPFLLLVWGNRLTIGRNHYHATSATKTSKTQF